MLSKEIAMNFPMRDRLDNLLSKKKAVERKDLVFMKFYIFSKYLEDKGEYTASDYNTFRYECDDMLVRCGFSRLYPTNRFENLLCFLFWQVIRSKCLRLLLNIPS